MYSSKATLRELVALLCAHGVHQVVLCPGSRNAPLTHSLASCPMLQATPLTDERSAAFTALGMCQALQEPVAVCCTSGSALLDMAPAVAEAYYQQLPLIVLSADRPPAWIGQLDGQTMVQTNAFAAFCRYQVSLPADEPQNAETLWQTNREINEALLAAHANPAGPVHINVPLSEPLFDFSSERLPQVRVIARDSFAASPLSPAACQELHAAQKIMLIIGQQAANAPLTQALTRLKAKNVLIVQEHLSNVPKSASHIGLAEMILAHVQQTQGDLEALRPDLVISIGGHVVSKRLKQFLRRFSPKQHWCISQDRLAPDTFQCLSRHIQSTALSIINALCAQLTTPKAATFCQTWETLEQTLRTQIQAWSAQETSFADLSAMQRFLAALPNESVLHLANSSPVRNAQYFPLPDNTIVCCNRGINGIDGSLSAAVGYAACSTKQVFSLIGDLSFFYDRNALWREQIPASLKILLFNNGGGEIFRHLPGLHSPHRDRYIAGSNSRNAQATALEAGIAYFSAQTLTEFETLLPRFIQEQGPLLFELHTNAQDCAQSMARLLQRSSL